MWDIRATIVGKSNGSLLEFWARDDSSLQDHRHGQKTHNALQSLQKTGHAMQHRACCTINKPLRRHYWPVCSLIRVERAFDRLKVDLDIFMIYNKNVIKNFKIVHKP